MVEAQPYRRGEGLLSRPDPGVDWAPRPTRVPQGLKGRTTARSPTTPALGVDDGPAATTKLDGQWFSRHLAQDLLLGRPSPCRDLEGPGSNSASRSLSMNVSVSVRVNLPSSLA
jgi:hypothetical protein